MRTTIDKAGRVVIPKVLRDRLGLRPGEVEIADDGNGVRIEPVTQHIVEQVGDRLVIPSAGTPLSADDVRDLRDAGQR